MSAVGSTSVRRGWLRDCGGALVLRSEREATPELCREMEAVEQAPQRPWRTEASRREAGTAVASIAGRVGKKRSWHPGHFFFGDLWESRREAEEQIGKGKEALGWLEEQWGYCVCLKKTTNPPKPNLKAG